MATTDLNIFCVDDDAAFQRYVSHALGNKYNIKHFSAGEECISRAQLEVVDLLIISTPLRGMSATEICEIFKDDSLLNQVPVIFISDINCPWEREHAFDCGCDDYLQKTSSPNEILSVVEMALDLDLVA